MTTIVRTTAGPSAAAQTRSALPPHVLLPLVAEYPLPVMFTGWGVFPRIVGVDGQDGGWDRIGKSRTIRLGDGGHVVETVVDFRAGESFSYELAGFTDVFGLIVRGVHGEWVFTPEGDGSRVRWTWTFDSYPGRRLLMAAVIAPLWQRYMQRMIDTAVADISRAAR